MLISLTFGLSLDKTRGISDSDGIITTSKPSLNCREDSTGGTSGNGAPDVRKHAAIRRFQ
jgi:hypothetical protein